MRTINWLGVAGGAASLLLAAISLRESWWDIVIGDDLLVARISPLNVRFYLLGNSFAIPLIWVFTLICALFLVAGGVALLIYAFAPLKPYSGKLLGFGYKKPIYVFCLFLAGLAILVVAPSLLLGVNVPLHGIAVIDLPQSFMQGTRVKVRVSTSIQWTFWLAAAVAALCVAARIYHGKIRGGGRVEEQEKVSGSQT